MTKYLVPLLLISTVFAQTEPTTPADGEIVLNQELPKNNFENLLSVEEIVLQLRENYGFKGSVLLTKKLGEILSSFSNQEQAQNGWQLTVNEVTKLDEASIPLVDFQFDSGQILSKYTHGMDLDKWLDKRTEVQANDNSLLDFLSYNDELTIYLNLEKVWQLLLENISQQDNIVWRDVFINSLTLFSESTQTLETIQNNDKSSSENNHSAIDRTEPLMLDFFVALDKWSKSENYSVDQDNELIDVATIINDAEAQESQLFTSLLRFAINKRNQHYLASSFAWFKVVYQLNSFQLELDKVTREIVVEFIEENDVWFLSKESKLLDINEQLPSRIEATIHQLKSSYQQQAEQQIDSQVFVEVLNLPNIYQLIEPQMNKYMATPFRNKIRQDLEVCLNISEEFAPFPQQPIDVNQFNGCVNDLTMAAVTEAGSRELSGSLTRVDTKKALDRALQLPPWQTINILQARVARADCLDESQQMVNPLEWKLAAESLLWFIDRWPAYSKKYQNKADIRKIIIEGEKLLKGLTCLDIPSSELLDVEFNQVEQAWQKVKTQIKQVAVEFNQLNLTAGSDLDLLTNSEETSNYRVEEATISACDVQTSCGVHAPLNTSRALFGLFPNHLLLADQLKLGKLKLCYDNVGWENRRSASTHLDNPNVANYFGNFSFSLKGYYEEQLVFERKLTSKEENYYLFAENDEEVLSTYCPLSIIGNKISTQLDRGTFGLVPNRLTFLTASRASESQILTSNWSDGGEWQDLITGAEAELVFESDLSELSADTQLAYQKKAKALQALVYQTLLNTVPEPTEKQLLLTDSISDLYRIRKLLAHMVYITQPDEFMTDDSLHGVFFGNNKIPDRTTIVELYKNQLNIKQLIAGIDENIKINQNKWNNFSSTWSNAYLKNILYRLRSLNNSQ